MHRRTIAPSQKLSAIGDTATVTFNPKVIVLGDTAVGKTNIITRFCTDTFSDRPKPTIGVEFYAKEIEVSARAKREVSSAAHVPSSAVLDRLTSMKLHVVDTAGEERGRALSNIVYRNVDGVVLVFDVCRRETFDNVRFWLEEVRRHATPSSLITSPHSFIEVGDSSLVAPVPMILVGNKCDLVHLKCVGEEEAAYFAESTGMVGYVEVSAYRGDHIEQIFDKLHTEILVRHVATRTQDDMIQSASASRRAQRQAGGQSGVDTIKSPAVALTDDSPSSAAGIRKKSSWFRCSI